MEGNQSLPVRPPRDDGSVMKVPVMNVPAMKVSVRISMRKFLLPLIALGALLGTPAFAALQVDVTQGNAQPLPIAIPDFLAGDASGANIAGVVRADLERSGLFKPIDPKAYVDHITDINVVPNFTNWRVINAQGLVTGAVTLGPD